MDKDKINLLSEFTLFDKESDNDYSEAFASVNFNPAVTWVKFILTDDKPNINKVRVPSDEFDNLVKTGVHMPIKMAAGRISEGHAGTTPIGSIAFLKKVKSQVIGLAALWNKERPEDVQLIKSNFEQKKPLQLSWEILYDEALADENGINDLKGTSLRAVTLVGMPAYAGRTPILAVASKWSDSYIESLPDESFLFVDGADKNGSESNASLKDRYFPYKDLQGKLDEELLRMAIEGAPNLILRDGNKISEATAEEIIKKAKELLPSESNMEESTLLTLEELQKKVEEQEKLIKEKDTALASKDERLVELEKSLEKLEELENFKAGIDKEKEEAEKLASIKSRFAEAKIEKDDKYFSDNKEKLLSLSQEAIDFMVQEFASIPKSANSSVLLPKIPNITLESGSEYSARELAEFLKSDGK